MPTASFFFSSGKSSTCLRRKACLQQAGTFRLYNYACSRHTYHLRKGLGPLRRTPGKNYIQEHKAVLP